MILFIDATAREISRTRRLAQHLIEKLDDEVTVRQLYDNPPTVMTGELLAKRAAFCAQKDFSDAYFDDAKAFAQADTIVIAAPFWDLSFPAALKQYLENICIGGLTFCYTPEGKPQGLCKAKKVYFVTTAGGPIMNHDFAYGYISALMKTLFSIEESQCICAEFLDVEGNDPEAILAEKFAEIDAML